MNQPAGSDLQIHDSDTKPAGNYVSWDREILKISQSMLNRPCCTAAAIVV